MDMVLLDWTRMGKLYCLAGAVSDGAGWKFVRPLLAKYKSSPVRNNGWSPFSMTNHARWEVFELVGAEPAQPQPPHTEDLWVVSMRSLRRHATADQRRSILQAGARPAGVPLFGVRLTASTGSAYLKPGTGERSLATLAVDAERIDFQAARREGAPEPDFRVTLGVPGLQGRWLPLKDHWLLLHGEQAGEDLDARLGLMAAKVRGMAPKVAVRLGLSRGFDPAHPEAPSQGSCWLMADGFFSLEDPQP